MRALKSDFKCRPSCNDLSAAPGVHSSQGHAIACTADAPHACKHSTYTRHAGYKRSGKGGAWGL